MLAPIALFVYNRPSHTQITLNALALNVESKDSELFIFCDGEKENCSDLEKENVKLVRIIVQNEIRFKKTNIIYQTSNIGLANSIIGGVNKVINEFGKVIVLEDDILPSLGFLSYMNEALNLYETDDNVGCIHAWNYHLNTEKYKTSTFFLKGADCWGWGTWKRAWNYFNYDSSFLLETIQNNKMEFEFNRKGTHHYVSMLKDQILGKIDSWAIRWHASLFINKMYCLHPVIPIVKNIGFDNSGTHCGIMDLNQQTVEYINLEKLDVIEDELFFSLYKKKVQKEKIMRLIEKIKKFTMLI